MAASMQILVLLATAYLARAQDPFRFNCTYQIVGQDDMVLSSFDDGFPGSWVGKVTAEQYQEDYTQHWEMGNYLGTNLTTLTPEDNRDNHISINLRRWTSEWGTQFPLLNTFNITKKEGNVFTLKKQLFQFNQTAEEINFGCITYMGPNQRVKMFECSDKDPRQQWRFSLIRAPADPNDKGAAKHRNSNCTLTKSS